MSAAESAGAPARRPGLAVPRLVGRDRDLSFLEQALDERSALVVLTGEAGIGKTRLLHEPGAARLFEEAGAAWAALPRPYDALLAREAAAGCHLAAGERDRAVGLLREIFGGLTALGATEDADRVRRTLADEGVRAGARSGRPGYGDQLSPRELDVVRLLVEGRTSAQIRMRRPPVCLRAEG